MNRVYWVFAGLGVMTVVLIVSGTHRQPASHSQRPAPSGSYVALGDSVAAGYGLETYSDPSACNRTRQAYPNLVAKQRNLKLTSLACSGATVLAGILGSQDVNDLSLPPQLDELFALPRPKLVTLTIGANDMGWTDLLTKCAVSDCGTPADSAVVDGRLAELTAHLQTILTKISEHYGSKPPQLIVTGYYQLLTPSLQSCPEMTGLDSSELAWERAQQTKLNATLQSASTSFHFASFAGPDFSGHELCSHDSWIQNISSSGPYHPTDAGQNAYAQVIK
jgi:lysophospholipase L1-like esterase